MRDEQRWPNVRRRARLRLERVGHRDGRRRHDEVWQQDGQGCGSNLRSAIRGSSRARSAGRSDALAAVRRAHLGFTLGGLRLGLGGGAAARRHDALHHAAEVRAASCSPAGQHERDGRKDGNESRSEGLHARNLRYFRTLGESRGGVTTLASSTPHKPSIIYCPKAQRSPATRSPSSSQSALAPPTPELTVLKQTLEATSRPPPRPSFGAHSKRKTPSALPPGRPPRPRATPPASSSARVAELADAPDLGSGTARCGGSSPSSCTRWPFGPAVHSAGLGVTTPPASPSSPSASPSLRLTDSRLRRRLREQVPPVAASVPSEALGTASRVLALAFSAAFVVPFPVPWVRRPVATHHAPRLAVVAIATLRLAALPSHTTLSTI